MLLTQDTSSVAKKDCIGHHDEFYPYWEKDKSSQDFQWQGGL